MNRHRQSVSSCSSHRSGVLAVESAFVLPIIIFMFAGCIELTAMNLIRQTAGNASYEAARKAMLPGGTEVEARQEAMRLLGAVGATRNVDVLVRDTGHTVTVTIRVPVGDNSWGLGRFTGDLTITKSCSLTRGHVD